VITDEDVIQLYRCLLGRAPETPDTIAAFRTYYPEFAQGRLAVLTSDEFSRVLRAQTGHVTAELTRRFLQRAGGLAQPLRETARPESPREAMRLMLRAHGGVRLAVVVGQASPDLADLLPLENAQAALVHISPDHPAFIPQTGLLPAGGTLFRVCFEPGALIAFLQQAGLRIDLLALLGAPPFWWDALQPCLAERVILVAGADTPLPDWADLEAPLHLPGVTLRHRGGWFMPVTYVPCLPDDTPETAVPGLAIAAIVRNEAASIVNMLASAAPVAGSFVVLDTGSTDDTFMRAQAFLNACGKPYVLQKTEPGRFDTMRNAALDLLPASAEWVLMLDADEELCAEDRAALRALLPGAAFDAYSLPRYNYHGQDKTGLVSPYPDRQVRLLRRTAGARYEGAVHETIRGIPVCRLPLDAGALGPVLGRDHGGPHIHHLVRRYRSPEAEARKQEHYRRIAEQHAQAPIEESAA
jgi:hypothetical protein